LVVDNPQDPPERIVRDEVPRAGVDESRSILAYVARGNEQASSLRVTRSINTHLGKGKGTMKAMLTFAVHVRGQLVRRQTVARDVVRIGTDTRSDVCVGGEGVLGTHAVIKVVSASELVLDDVGGELGTEVNGVRVGRSVVGVGDQISVGRTVLVLESVQEVVDRSLMVKATSHASTPMGSGERCRVKLFESGGTDRC